MPLVFDLQRSLANGVDAGVQSARLVEATAARPLEHVSSRQDLHTARHGRQRSRPTAEQHAPSRRRLYTRAGARQKPRASSRLGTVPRPRPSSGRAAGRCCSTRARLSLTFLPDAAARRTVLRRRAAPAAGRRQREMHRCETRARSPCGGPWAEDAPGSRTTSTSQAARRSAGPMAYMWRCRATPDGRGAGTISSSSFDTSISSTQRRRSPGLVVSAGARLRRHACEDSTATSRGSECVRGAWRAGDRRTFLGSIGHERPDGTRSSPRGGRSGFRKGPATCAPGPESAPS